MKAGVGSRRGRAYVGPRRQGGFSLIELSIALIIAAVLFVLGVRAFNDYIDGLVNNASANHAVRVMDAALNYIADNKASLLASSGVGTPTTISRNQLVAGGYLDASVPDTNSYGQVASVPVCRTAANELEAFVLYRGGEVINGKNLRAVANSLGIAGGFVEDASGVAKGAYGGWSRNLSACGGSATNPGAGHLVVALSLKASAEQMAASSYVHRTSVPGRPELNRMMVNMDMGGNEVRNASRVISSGRIAAGEYVELQGLATAGTACAPNGLLARDISGRMLSCVTGAWRIAGT